MTAVLDIHGITVTFGGRAALRGVDLTAEAGSVTGLIGPNGAGKTTLFNVACGLQPPTRGRVRLAGEDVTDLPPFKRARRGLARTFQRLEPFGLLTVHDNVRLAAAQRGGGDPSGRADELLGRLGIRALAQVRADRLPTGQARMVELARALATGPQVLLLDEPASGQDEQETAHFARIVRDVASGGVAVVLVEHDIQLVMDLCETVHVLDLGQVLASGPPAAIRSDPAVLGAYLGQAT